MPTDRTPAMKTRMALAVAAVTVALAGCDAATQIAGEAVHGEVRNAIDAQCRQAAENAGIVAARVAQVCACSVETFLAGGDASLADIDPARVEGIVNGCASSTGAADASTEPTEEIGG